ncbi:tRNA uridine-5-carboxymethylaminomethyl(34) synthesis GTPase MnmE [Paracoccus seriniphilus]|uniref:tRNA modification GTPase MnmE n=1 Tax=Paracoccus seriniphilus TaxID=184748 RepID=A0A239PYD8_9RHOB|nr:tRNA uridine-5-carboxymethylaminomethyl(34) synthesis GTPase MnmE [Paracoccus seriniphilus]WCR14084.1 tRNA uridine-5-carboxymethylaminomethyl(34) synthesis GTPase MnmE [Paracoccus seriniphilus]SNT74986.1 tRNA modification GTPase trmE [Paracoccus seriniphilus]
MDLIFAEATPPGRGGVSVIRISGEGARHLAERLCGFMPKSRHAYFRTLRDGNEDLDHVLAMWFEYGASFTGEEVAELHLHGAPVIARRVLSVLSNLGARPAEAGEFTRRAFLNGRMDLAEVEGLGDLLEAETETQRRLALRASGGELGKKVMRWRDMLIRAGALVEVSVDFADEEVPDDVPPEVFDLLKELRSEIDLEISGFPAAERLRTGFEVAIVGPPNAGKSSLINKIAKRDVALVSDIAGTTRDVIELRMDLNGLAVTLLDTAGLRDTDDHVEGLGVDVARRRASSADLRIHLSDMGKADPDLYAEGDIVARSKADLQPGDNGISISSLSGQGIDELLSELYSRLRQRIAGAGIVSHERQVAALRLAADSLTIDHDLPAELVAESIRQTAVSLDRLLGRIGAEEYLDVIFSSFCIGK